MSNGDLFYVCGAVLTASAVIFTIIGLRVERFPGRLAPLVTLWFVAFVGATTTFAVLHAKDEEKHEEAELRHANEEAEPEAAAAAGGAEGQGQGHAPEGNAPKPARNPSRAAEKPSKPAAAGPGGTLMLAADPAQIAYDKSELSSKPGKVTIDLDNPSALEHDVAIAKGGKTLAASETVSESATSLSVELTPGEYTFLCTVPGHAEAGMEGTLTVE
jgi:plastocyanin